MTGKGMTETLEQLHSDILGYNEGMKKELPYPQDPKAFALWIAQQDTLADAQIAG
jgi:hypothetical protein